MRRLVHPCTLLLVLPATALAFCGLGFDFGTSGVRIAVLSPASPSTASPSLVHEAALPWPHPGAVQEAEEWRKALLTLLDEIPASVRSCVARIAVSGTSASCLVVDRGTGAVRRPARLYNWDALREAPTVGKQAQAILAEYAPPKHTTLSGTSTLMKVLAWQLEEAFHPQEVMLHQADFLAGCLMHDPTSSSSSFPRASDWNNMLKLGYDMSSLTYPPWFSPLLNTRLALPDYTALLPTHIVEPGQKMGPVSPTLVQQLSLAPGCTVVGGTTDSIAAFLAAGVDQPGQAVSSLGSTLAIKVGLPTHPPHPTPHTTHVQTYLQMLSRTAVEDATRGVYSHRLGDLWLVGGASNVGCAVLREQGFSNEELAALSREIDPLVDSPLDYYPLGGWVGGLSVLTMHAPV